MKIEIKLPKISRKLFGKITILNICEITMNKVGCNFPMVIRFRSRIEQSRDDDHRKDALHFTGGILNNDFKYQKSEIKNQLIFKTFDYF